MVGRDYAIHVYICMYICMNICIYIYLYVYKIPRTCGVPSLSSADSQYSATLKSFSLKATQVEWFET